MFKNILKINLLIFLFTTIVYSEIVDNVKILGNKRISDQSIIIFGDIKLNKDYDENNLNLILKKLYQTNFFKSINIGIENKTLNLNLIENPIIESLQITGIPKQTLVETILGYLSLKERSSFVESFFLKDVNIIRNIVKQNGYYFAKIETSKIYDEKLNTIQVVYDIKLGDKAKISKIEFLGDKKIKDRKLRSLIASEEDRFWKVISGKTNLDKSRVNLDTRLLLNFYKNNGYFNAEITNSFAELVDDNSFKLIFNINAGKKYFFNDFNLTVPKNYDVTRFDIIKSDFLKIKGKAYSPSKVAKILKEIDKIALSKEFQFINSSINETIVEDDKINLLVKIIESDVFYVEKINVIGNQYTLEEVIRNDLIVDEGDPYNEILFNKSINSLRSKGYFGSVKTNVVEGSNKDKKIIDIEVNEKPTGEISLAAGLGTTGASLGGGIRENNFLGKGIKLKANMLFSETGFNGSFAYERPYFKNTDNTLVTSVNSTSTDNLSDYGYKTRNIGFALGTAFEQYENLTLRPTFDINYEKLETTATASDAVKKQHGSYFDTYFNYTLDYDLRDQRYQATEGTRTIFSQNIPTISSNYELTNSIEHIIYKPLSENMIGRVSFFGRMVNSLVSDKDVRISKRLFVPSRKLRGFQSGKIGPIQNGDFIGGNYVSALNFSTTLPQFLPSLENTDVSLFLDAANAWGVDYDSSVADNNTIRSAFGVSFDMSTVIGPLNFSFSQPITKKSSDKTESFRFNLGTTF